MRFISTLLKLEISTPLKTITNNCFQALEGLKFQALEGLKFQNKSAQKQMTQTFVSAYIYGSTGFQTGGTKLARYLPKNQHTQRIFLNFENWTGEVSKSAKSPNLPTFKVNFLYQKLSESFSIFFSLKNINLGAHFLLLTFFDSINF